MIDFFCSGKARIMYRNMAVAFDESPEAKRALKTAIQLAKTLGTGLRILTVMEKLPAYTAYASGADDPSLSAILEEDRKKFYEELQAGAVKAAKEDGVEPISHLLDGETVSSLVDCICQQKVDLLVIGLHKRQNLVSRMWSTVYTIAQNVPCSVLGVH